MDDDDDATKRRDELDALRAIYGDDITVDAPDALTVRMRDGAWRCAVKLPRDYPSSSAPVADVLAVKTRTERAMEIERWAADAMLDAWDAARGCGAVCVFDWLERVRGEIEDAEDAEDAEDENEQSVRDELAAIAAESARWTRGADDASASDARMTDVRRRLTSYEPIVEKKSIFQAHVCRNATSVDDVDATMKILSESRKFREATHNILAYRIEHANGSTFWQDFDDDGETAAGGRLLRVLQLSDARNVVVVVSRWYGGTKLGPKRFQVINTVALDAIAASSNST